MIRGRLIFKFWAEICRFDPASMTQSPMGFDPDFREPRLRDDGKGIAKRERVELPPIKIPCQVEPKAYEATYLGPSGDSPRSELTLVFHFRDLERLNLVDPETGIALIRPNDRLAGLYDFEGRLVQAIPTPPGLYVREAEPRGFGLGLSGSRRNLLIVTFEARPLAPTRVN